MWFRLKKNNIEVPGDLTPEPNQLSPSATFCVRAEGQYTCQYLGSNQHRSDDYFSSDSNPVNVRNLPKPTISMEKDPGGTGGYRVTCSQTTINAEKQFTLHCGQDPNNKPQKVKTGIKHFPIKDGIFILPRDTGGTEGMCRCSYQITGERLESPYSDTVLIGKDVQLQAGPTENSAPDDGSSLILYISIPCAIVLLVLFLVTLMYYLTSRTKKATAKKPPRMMPWEENGVTTIPAASAKTLNVPAEKERENLAVPMHERENETEEEEDRCHGDVTYATLNPEVLKKKSPAPITPVPESNIYAAVNVK
ncbi:uncharacterized protein LOC115466570 [Microcaecilia unicolor]|uniref:Uncharacterized protein LOC115466570 n=1 Tax=Microcaecilia unicolor TaxID=1415580 RepID=A0A6P7XSW7_9AMPH|nr:uncharacterized protein LOC115466570 [Microcaecilia unicolor]